MQDHTQTHPNPRRSNELNEDDQIRLRSQIRSIHLSTEYTHREKNRLIQRLMLRLPSDPGPPPATTGESEIIIPQHKSYQNEEKGILGCRHYTRQARIVASCCKQIFSCRLCHDEQCNHTIDRHAIESMICMHCNTLMPVGNTCSNSDCSQYGQPLAHYYCNICRFFDDDNTKDIYHCQYCGLCRRGKGLEVDFRHCPACNACISLKVFDTHKCIERSLESNCPICHEFMFTSIDPVIFMVCGHAMHSECFKSYTATDYTCPICLKSVVDIKDHFDMLDTYVSAMEIPEEYRGMRAKVLCNDCLARTETDFHFYYHKCLECGSFNTNVLSKWHPGTIVSGAAVTEPGA